MWHDGAGGRACKWQIRLGSSIKTILYQQQGTSALANHSLASGMSSHRPTWTPATGASLAPTFQYSSKDLNSHTRLKLRNSLGLQQAGNVEVQREERAEEKATVQKPDDEDFAFEHQGEGFLENSKEEFAKDNTGRGEVTGEKGNDQDHADTGSGGDGDGEGKGGEEESEEEDDTEALLRELEKIKREREDKRQLQEREEKKAKAREAVASNPLLLDGAAASFAVKQRWDDDVVFRNQAKGVEEKPQKRFINDTLRSDFHRKFLDRYIK